MEQIADSMRKTFTIETINEALAFLNKQEEGYSWHSCLRDDIIESIKKGGVVGKTFVRMIEQGCPQAY